MTSRSRYIIKEKINETKNVIILRLVPKEGKIFEYKPGQFCMIHILNSDGSTWQKRAYSMASSPLNKEYLEFGIKIFGQFTHKISKLNKGDEIDIEGPYGVFTYDKNINKNLVIFAGGIGITPFMSMIRYATESAPENKIMLYYFNQTEKDIAYKKDIEKLSNENQNLTIIYSVDKCNNKNWSGEVGLINEKKVKLHIQNFEEKNFFICGPRPFMNAVEKILKRFSVTKDHIKKELF